MLKISIILLAFISINNSFSEMLGIRKTQYIGENFLAFHEGHTRSSFYYVPEIAKKHFLGDYIYSKMQFYVDAADDFIRIKNGEKALRPTKIMGTTAFRERVKAAPYMVMKYDIKNNGSSDPSKWSYKWNEERAKEQKLYLRKVSRKIEAYIGAAKSCFHVDPLVLASLIHAESYYSPVAVSFRNAVGLTQFTSIAFGEIAMQVGAIPYEATDDAVAYNQDQIQCMQNVTGEEIVDLTELYDGQLYVKQGNGARVLSTGALPDLRNHFKDNMLASITYGSILLKTYLAYHCRLSPSSKCSKENNVMIWDKEYLYKTALKQYNGDNNINRRTGRVVKDEYADKIWKSASGDLKNFIKDASFIIDKKSSSSRR